MKGRWWGGDSGLGLVIWIQLEFGDRRNVFDETIYGISWNGRKRSSFTKQLANADIRPLTELFTLAVKHDQ